MFGVGLVLALSSLSAGCIAPASDGVAMRVSWGLTDPAASLPDDVALLRLIIDVEGEELRDPSFTVANLEDADDNGRPELDLGEITPGVPVTISIEGQDAGGGTLYVGRAGPFVLQHGERRYVDIRMYPVNDAAVLDASAFPARFLHTATSLADGRILLAGGFDRLTPTPCPADVLVADARCFGAVASDDAALFEPATGRLRPTRAPMLASRGAHTATLLPDGRVLIAGGAETATLVFEPQTGGFSFRIVPGGGGATFELFDPALGAEEEDIDRDGDPLRGAFVGAAADAAEPGLLDAARVMHAATLLDGGRVLLAGGLGAPGTFTVFDPQRAGGYGVVGSGPLDTPRGLPGAVTLGSGSAPAAWILGGAPAIGNDELAEVWAPGTGTDRLGSTEPATSAADFPNELGTGRPELALLRPLTAVLGGGTHALVVGWYGPRCDDTGPIFSTDAPLCGYVPSSVRSYTINAATGVATPTMVPNAHAFGAIATLDDGRVAVSGGFNALTMQAGNTIDLFTGAVSMGLATPAANRPPLRAPRALHTTVAVPGGGLVTFGGILTAPNVASITLVGGLEVVYLR